MRKESLSEYIWAKIIVKQGERKRVESEREKSLGSVRMEEKIVRQK